MTASMQIRSYFERWQRLEQEKQAIADDLKELFAEAKGNGFDTKAMRAVFREQTGDKAEREEFNAICDLYRVALDGEPRAHPAPARTREIDNSPAPERKTAGSAPRNEGSEGANTGGENVDRSASARPSGQELIGSQPAAVEAGTIDRENVERNTSGPDAKRAPIPPLPHCSPSQGAATALEGRMSSPVPPAIVSSSGPVHFADREHLTVPDDVDLSIPAFLKRSA